MSEICGACASCPLIIKPNFLVSGVILVLDLGDGVANDVTVVRAIHFDILLCEESKFFGFGQCLRLEEQDRPFNARQETSIIAQQFVVFSLDTCIPYALYHIHCVCSHRLI